MFVTDAWDIHLSPLSVSCVYHEGGSSEGCTPHHPPNCLAAFGKHGAFTEARNLNKSVGVVSPGRNIGWGRGAVVRSGARVLLFVASIAPIYACSEMCRVLIILFSPSNAKRENGYVHKASVSETLLRSRRLERM